MKPLKNICDLTNQEKAAAVLPDTTVYIYHYQMFPPISALANLMHYCAPIQLLIIVFVDRSSPNTQMGTPDLLFCLNSFGLLYLRQTISNCVLTQ